jgi:hypothetical protein
MNRITRSIVGAWSLDLGQSLRQRHNRAACAGQRQLAPAAAPYSAAASATTSDPV